MQLKRTLFLQHDQLPAVGDGERPREQQARGAPAGPTAPTSRAAPAAPGRPLHALHARPAARAHAAAAYLAPRLLLRV